MSNSKIFCLYFFIFFFIMGAYFPFFPIWLEMQELSRAETGIVFAFLSFFSLLFQPIFGIISDKLGTKKNLMYTISVMLIFFAPFFIYILGPALKLNIILGAMAGGIYLGFVFLAGMGAVEAYVDKLSRLSNFEFGQVRMYGCFGWGICASFVGYMISININMVFWICSFLSIFLIVLIWMLSPEYIDESKKQNKVSFATVSVLLKRSKTWMLIFYVVGIASVYEVFDQQFANFFTGFFESEKTGRKVFGYITTGGEFLNAFVMFLSPLIISRIGIKKSLLLAGMIMTIRITGSGFAQGPVEVIVLKTLHMLEAPLFLVAILKYINEHFEEQLSATVFLIAYYFSKQVVIMILAPVAGYLYDVIGFSKTYMMLGSVALTTTIISAYTLCDKKTIKNVESANI